MNRGPDASVAATTVRRPDLASLRATLDFARPVRRRILAGALLGAASEGCAIGLLVSAAWLLSRSAQHPSIAVLGLAIALVRFFAIARGLFRYGSRLVGHDAAFRLLGDLRVASYDRLEVLAPDGMASFRRSDLLARLVGDIESLQDLVLRVVPPFVIAAVVGAGSVFFIALLLPGAAAVFAVCLVAGGAVVPLLTRYLARRGEVDTALRRGELSTAIVDLVDGADELAVNGATATHLDRVRRADAALTASFRAAARTAGIGQGLSVLSGGLAILGMVLVAVPAVQTGRLEGVWLASLVLLPLAAFEVVAGLPSASQDLEVLRGSAARVTAMFDAEPVVTDPPHPLAVPTGPPTVLLRGVAVHRPDVEDPVLVDIDLDLTPGRRVAVVGRSGAGKSTLAHTLVGFLPYDGSISVGGREFRDLAGDDVREQVGLVAQDAHVFNTTIRQNLRIGRSDATDEELFAALARVRLDRAVAALPDGLDTWVGADGATLSGGQRQRLVVARALLRDFALLVLDEPAEHLDAATADALIADLADVTRSQSCVLITHRLVGLETMDEIVVLDGGRITERGTHRQLCAAGDWYARMAARQSGAVQPVRQGDSR